MVNSLTLFRVPQKCQWGDHEKKNFDFAKNRDFWRFLGGLKIFSIFHGKFIDTFGVLPKVSMNLP